jgi:hypothetical protein
MNKELQEEYIEHYKAFPDVIFFNLAEILNKVSLFFITKGTFESKNLLCKNENKNPLCYAYCPASIDSFWLPFSLFLS